MFGFDDKTARWLIFLIVWSGSGLCETPSQILNSSTVMTLMGMDKIRILEKTEVWISAESDKDLGHDGCQESALCRLLDFEGTLFDSTGKIIRELEKDDQKESTYSFDSVHKQHQTKYHLLSNPALPYRVQRSKEYEMRSALLWPVWDPQSKVGVENARLEVVVKNPLDFRYKNIGPVKGPETSVDSDGLTHLMWTAADIPRFVQEYRYDPSAEMQIGVRLGSRMFDLDGFEGSCENWRTFGDWFYRLTEDRTDFKSPFPELDTLQSLSAPRDKIKSLYRLLQNGTRYVQINLGIDGFQPHPVDDIHRTRYGDCKDLSVYFIAMLKKLGIQAYPALVLTRNVGIVDSSIISSQFNHCIAVVPTDKDTLWMECTSDESAYDDPPPNLEGAFALLVKPGESRMIRIPESKAESNASNLKAVAELRANRDLDVRGTWTLTGNQAYFGRSQLSELNPQKQRDWFLREFGGSIGEGEMRSFSIFGLDKPDSALVFDFHLTLKLYARKAGNRFLMPARLLGDTGFKGETPEERKLPLFNQTTRTDRDSVRFILPVGFQVNADTINRHIASEFGEYVERITPTADGVLWTSAFTLNTREVPIADYPDYYAFMKKTCDESGKTLVIRSGSPSGSGNSNSF